MFSRLMAFSLIFFNYGGNAFQLKIKCDDQIVLGATLNCTTWVLDDDGRTPADGKFRYMWKDDAIPQNNKLTETGLNIDTWSVTYNRSVYTAGGYIIRVDVCKWLIGFICALENSAGAFFHLTESLNGQIILEQGNQSMDAYVSTATALQSKIALIESDESYIAKAPKVLTYWFVDCVYYGITTDFQFMHNLKKPEEEHMIESLVVADFTPLPPPTTVPPPTTTTKPTTSTSTTTTSTTPVTKATTTTMKPKSKREAPVTPQTTVTTASAKNVSSSEIHSNIKVWQNGVLVPYNGSFPYVCNSTVISTDSKKVYGYFQKVVTTKDPISNITVSGNNWLQHGELLSLDVKCKGSKRMQFCYFFRPGLYNVTGNETCHEYNDLEECDFPIKRYFQDEHHTVIIIIKNDVSKQVTSVAVTIYKVKKQAQLSIIVVPVAFSLVAVVTIVFGVAYYFQNRSRFTVEVADFDFGQKYADMEYKTFTDRLKDSIVNAFTRDPMPSTSDAPLWPPGHKYGSMT